MQENNTQRMGNNKMVSNANRIFWQQQVQQLDSRGGWRLLPVTGRYRLSKDFGRRDYYPGMVRFMANMLVPYVFFFKKSLYGI